MKPTTFQQCDLRPNQQSRKEKRPTSPISVQEFPFPESRTQTRVIPASVSPEKGSQSIPYKRSKLTQKQLFSDRNEQFNLIRSPIVEFDDQNDHLSSNVDEYESNTIEVSKLGLDDFECDDLNNDGLFTELLLNYCGEEFLTSANQSSSQSSTRQSIPELSRTSRPTLDPPSQNKHQKAPQPSSRQRSTIPPPPFLPIPRSVPHSSHFLPPLPPLPPPCPLPTPSVSANTQKKKGRPPKTLVLSSPHSSPPHDPGPLSPPVLTLSPPPNPSPPAPQSHQHPQPQPQPQSATQKRAYNKKPKNKPLPSPYPYPHPDPYSPYNSPYFFPHHSPYPYPHPPLYPSPFPPSGSNSSHHHPHPQSRVSLPSSQHSNPHPYPLPPLPDHYYPYPPHYPPSSLNSTPSYTPQPSPSPSPVNSPPSSRCPSPEPLLPPLSSAITFPSSSPTSSSFPPLAAPSLLAVREAVQQYLDQELGYRIKMERAEEEQRAQHTSSYLSLLAHPSPQDASLPCDPAPSSSLPIPQDFLSPEGKVDEETLCLLSFQARQGERRGEREEARMTLQEMQRRHVEKGREPITISFVANHYLSTSLPPPSTSSSSSTSSIMSDTIARFIEREGRAGRIQLRLLESMDLQQDLSKYFQRAEELAKEAEIQWKGLVLSKEQQLQETKKFFDQVLIEYLKRKIQQASTLQSESSIPDGLVADVVSPEITSSEPENPCAREINWNELDISAFDHIDTSDIAL